MRKRYIPAFVVEGIVIAMMLYNLAEMATGGILCLRPGIWLLGVLTTILTAPAFIMWMLERRQEGSKE